MRTVFHVTTHSRVTPDSRSEWPMEVICAFPSRAALSPAADKATGTPQPPAHAGERTLQVLAVVLRVPLCARRVPLASTQSMPTPVGHRAGRDPEPVHMSCRCAQQSTPAVRRFMAHASTHCISPISMGVLRVPNVSTRSPDLSSSSTECE
jgi:hypothetical protein